jgi:hypothetical protein
MNIIKSEQKTHSERQSEQVSEQLQAAPQAKANTTNGKNRARTCREFFIFIARAIISHTRAYKNSVRSVRSRCLSGFEVFAQVFALPFAFGFGVRFVKKALKTTQNGAVA